ISGGATGVVDPPQYFAVTVDNYGKTPAFIGTIWAKIVPENELPDTPVYDPPEFGRFGGQTLKPDTSGHFAGVTRLLDVIEGRVIYGRIWYRDIFKECHSAGFICAFWVPAKLSLSQIEMYIGRIAMSAILAQRRVENRAEFGEGLTGL